MECGARTRASVSGSPVGRRRLNVAGYAWISVRKSEPTVEHVENQRSGRYRTHRLKRPSVRFRREQARCPAKQTNEQGCVVDRTDRGGRALMNPMDVQWGMSGLPLSC